MIVKENRQKKGTAKEKRKSMITLMIMKKDTQENTRKKEESYVW